MFMRRNESKMINYDLSLIRAIVFDVDGVLSRSTINMDEGGQPVRTINIKDGYAMQLAQKLGLRLAIMTGGHSEAIRKRYSYLGVKDIYMDCSVKITSYEQFLKDSGLTDEAVMYVGDDIPDYEVMRRCGCSCCPADACSDIMAIATYVSSARGGEGVARDVIEQVLRAQGLWLKDAKAFGW